MERLGRRIAARRSALALTQGQLASRVAMSRTGLSHVEAGMTVPSERTVALLAAVLGTDPWSLVEGTDYPQAKAERLPLGVPTRTEVDLALSLLDNDLGWLERLGDRLAAHERRAVVDEWGHRLRSLAKESPDLGDRALLRDALDRLAGLL
ncbi:MAG: helix-turn-helix domain-containing protein [Actinomycetota bacterium]|nr:helix-turn-helix domain-containing protein [Actinomycetota bacterium]